MADTIKATNELIKSHCESHPRLEYLDIWTPMLDASGQPRPELLSRRRPAHEQLWISDLEYGSGAASEMINQWFYMVALLLMTVRGMTQLLILVPTEYELDQLRPQIAPVLND